MIYHLHHPGTDSTVYYGIYKTDSNEKEKKKRRAEFTSDSNEKKKKEELNLHSEHIS